MGLTGDDYSNCAHDHDCSETQYCYKVSMQCVNYTKCENYYRKEATKHAKDPSQCGPCFDGYEAELLSTGKRANICKIAQHSEDTHSNSTIIYISAGILFIIILLVGFVYLKRKRKRRNSHNIKSTDIAIIKPSAPPPENSPFIPYEDAISLSIINNNQNVKDKNRLVAASPFKEPSWVRPDSNYGQNIANDNIPQQPNAVVILNSDEDTNPSSWTPEQNSSRQVSIQIPNRPFAQLAAEQRDNTLTDVLVQGTCPENSSDSVNSDDNANTEFNDTQGTRANSRTSNVILTQKINLNLNLLNGDC